VTNILLLMCATTVPTFFVFVYGSTVLSVNDAYEFPTFSERLVLGSRYCEGGYHWLCISLCWGGKGYTMAGLVDGVVDFALHCMAGMDGIPGFSFERMVWRCLELCC
jgi:hypothetical protein